MSRYRNGNDHIGEHRDDESELDVEAGIASVSLGQVILLFINKPL